MKKRIAVIITRMVVGGASKVVSQIIDCLKDKYEFTLICGEEDIREEEKKELARKYKVIFIPDLVRDISPFRDLKAYFALRKHLHEGQYDIVHTHTSKAGFLGRLAAQAGGVKKILHNTHGTIYDSGSRIPGVPDQMNIFKRLLMYCERYVGKFTDKLIVLSTSEKNLSDSLRLARTNRIVVIPNGIDVEFFLRGMDDYCGARKELGIDDDVFFIVSVGRISEEKGYRILLEAYRELCSQVKDKKVLLGLVGDGPLKNELEGKNLDLIRDKKIVFYGFQKDVRKFLFASNLYVQPSLYEGFGIAILEAMASGLWVVAANSGGISELLGDDADAILYEPENRAKLSLMLAEFLEKHDACFKNSDRNIVRAKEFALAKMIKEYERLYEEE